MAAAESWRESPGRMGSMVVGDAGNRCGGCVGRCSMLCSDDRANSYACTDQSIARSDN
jgi:hypothetical protein